MEENSFNSNKKKPSGKTPYLDSFGEDLTKLAEEKKLDPIIGRDEEIQRICQILARRKKNNPIILGDPGVGKTAIVEAIAQRIVEKKVARILLGKRIVSINMASIVAGTKYRGEFEERMKAIVDELKENPDVIIFIDEIHTVVGAGGVSGSLDASNILKPALARGQVQCIGATTLDEYRENIEDDGALTRRFQEVFIDPPSVEDTVEILRRIKGQYEDHHAVSYTEEALVACAKMSDRYITQRELPDKAIDVMDEAGAKMHIAEVKLPLSIKKIENEVEAIKVKKLEYVKKQDYEGAATYRDKEMDKKKELEAKLTEWENSLNKEKKLILEEHIAEVIAQQTGIPVSRLKDNDQKALMKLGEDLRAQVIGQDEAVEALAKVIRRSRAGVSNPNKPIGSFMFIGPTGVGKTETVKALTRQMFGTDESLIKIDMSEYQEKFNVSRLIGAPPGYVGHEDGGQLTEAVRRKPYSVVLFDEVEKAHPDIFHTLLQVLDEGRLTDSLGRTVDFRNTIIVMTSNIGARKVADFGSGIGFKGEGDEIMQRSKIDSIIKKELKTKFAPEFLNRLDDIILFDDLKQESIIKIIDIELNKLKERMADQYTLSFGKPLKEFIAEVGYDPAFGARPLKRAIQHHVEDVLSDAIIMNSIKDPGKVIITYDKKTDKVIIK
jgi:ATP-dependent Clp protease ATP-binding subunit ClpC